MARQWRRSRHLNGAVPNDTMNNTVRTQRVIDIPIEPRSRKRLATEFIDKGDGDERRYDVHCPGKHIDEQRVIPLNPAACQSTCAVIEHHVDSHELLENTEDRYRPTRSEGPDPFRKYP